MPGIILNPIANYGFGQGQQPPPPYIPSYDSVYIASPDLYYYSGSDLYTDVNRTGGIAKLPFTDSGSLDTAGWSTTVNGAGTNNTPIYTNWASSLREYVLMDWEIESGSQSYVSLQLVNKHTASVRYESTFLDTAGTSLGMKSAPDESYILFYGQEYLKTKDGVTSPAGIAKLPYSTITTFATQSVFDVNLGNGANNHTTGGAIGQIHDIFIEPDGKLGVAHNGLYWNNSTSSYHNFVVLNNDGTLDSSFNFGPGQFTDQFDDANYPNGLVRSVYYFDNPTDGKKRWIVAGDFKKFNGTTYNHILAFDETGSLDSSFNTGVGTAFNAPVRGMFKIDDDFVAVVGDFNNYNNTNAERLVILRYDGALLNGLESTNGNRIWNGVYHNEYLYLRGDFTTVTASGTTYNANGIFSLKTNMNTINPAFDYGNGMTDRFGTGSIQEGAIFLG